MQMPIKARISNIKKAKVCLDPKQPQIFLKERCEAWLIRNEAQRRAQKEAKIAKAAAEAAAEAEAAAKKSEKVWLHDAWS